MSAFYVKNVPGWERALRIVAGSGAAAYALYSFAGPMGWLLAASAAGIAISGLVGFCPMCAMVGRRLDKKA
ncbi:DUF2892 domain-containing protein [Rhodoferax sp. AJA081-3]|uniref:YgaP family membrane protein n=1 Tax=Rhodoferax sp. AJA081-3 TaxID=2752316 RepID=UPI001ADF59C9|nr:DUF2892 domain-containing protein [Rhodoferax sp. AJA081-3]QTN27237.1 DUF2892 domain-containing protein [Rhodoferax sp. AJA081-3]